MDNSSDSDGQSARDVLGFPTFRRIVTGHDRDGKSICISDTGVPAGPGWMHDLWQTAVPASNAAASPSMGFPLRLAPPSSGLTFRIMKVPPRSVLDSLTKEDIAKILREIGANDAGVPSEHMLMHRTRTLDLLVVLSGRVTLHLENGDLNLKPLDCVVQRGTAHAWSTPDETAASVAVILVDAPT
ncbi:MAG TPA: hypothetical protein VGN43_11780 [Steroidobacteraceae bacterium]|nr:hypothetical protein [Steroidobacteraceae bacterium]